jgi:hypothetical protein
MSPRIAVAVAAATLVSALALGALQPVAGAAPQPGGGTGKIEPRKGTYRGKTAQRSVARSARTIEFDLNRKGTRIELTVEPTVARDFCIAPPVFVVDGETASARLKRGRFGFSRTFVGSRFDRIKGRFIAPEEIEGEAVYNFAGSDAGLCAAGTTKVRFSAKRRD